MRVFIANKGVKSQWNGDSLIHGIGRTRGGGVFFEKKTDIEISRSFFGFNHVQMDGGGIYLYNCSKISIHHNMFIMNGAKWGGAVYLEKCSDIHIFNNCFLFNFAIRDGGAISVSNSDYIEISHNAWFFNIALRSCRNIDNHNSKKILIK